jgi:hypothetical protein
MTSVKAKSNRAAGFMSSVIETISGQLLNTAPAANADRLGEHLGNRQVTETSTGWDSYEVWRRFIKEARDRRLTEQK